MAVRLIRTLAALWFIRGDAQHHHVLVKVLRSLRIPQRVGYTPEIEKTHSSYSYIWYLESLFPLLWSHKTCILIFKVQRAVQPRTELAEAKYVGVRVDLSSQRGIWWLVTVLELIFKVTLQSLHTFTNCIQSWEHWVHYRWIIWL